ncbi:MAG: glutamine-hydrolyzing GMP synthase [Armatimonadota bacterium]
MIKEKVLVLDFGSQYNRLIVRAAREAGVYSQLIPHSVTAGELKKLKPTAIILSGGPASVYDKNAPKLDPDIYGLNIPVLGICYGMQLITHQLGGIVFKSGKREYGANTFNVTEKDSLFKGIQGKNTCWMSHQDEVKKVPEGFKILAESSYGKIAAIANKKRKIFGVQFHPEVAHTPRGAAIIKNFLKAAGCTFSWTPKEFIKEIIADIKKETGNEKIFCALSGGVDSTVAALLVKKAAGGKLSCLLVDNGLLREGEVKNIKEAMVKQLGLKLKVLDAGAHFLKKLKGVTDPEEKRKIIGREFVRIFEKEIKDKIKFMVQGTLYPDIIESGGGKYSKSAIIKTHHNVGGLPDDFKFKLIEPLKYLFKDEVRRVGKTLGIPQEILQRQPFPGPGLAVRVLGEITEERLKTLRKADKIVSSTIEKYDLNNQLWQYFAVLLPLKTVGVMGDQRTYNDIIAVRAVYSRDAMTAKPANISWEIMEELSTKIVNEVPGINRVVYDITSKPPGTIEWE